MNDKTKEAIEVADAIIEDYICNTGQLPQSIALKPWIFAELFLRADMIDRTSDGEHSYRGVKVVINEPVHNVTRISPVARGLNYFEANAAFYWDEDDQEWTMIVHSSTEQEMRERDLVEFVSPKPGVGFERRFANMKLMIHDDIARKSA